MASYDIVGYTYNADIYCPDCIAEMFSPPGGYRRLCSYETILDRAAAAMGVNREDERSFDSDHFPKVVFEDMAEDDRCGNCGGHLTDPEDD